MFAAVVLATALCTLVGMVRERLACPRGLALGLSLLAVLLVAVVVATAIIPPFVEEFGQLIQKLPQAADMVLKLLREGLGRASSMLYGTREGGLAWLTRGFGGSSGSPSAIATGLGGGAVRLLGLAGNLGAGLLQTLFVVAVALMVAAQPEAYREVVLLQCGEALSGWMVGVLISSLCVGLLAAIGLSLLGVNLVAANAVLAGLLNVIPNVGPTLSTIFPMSVALLEAPWKAAAVLVLYIVVQNLESYVITPSVMHHQLKLLPGLTLTAQLLFTVLFGPLGLVLARPLAVCLQVILREVVIRDILDPWKRQRPAA
jgi:predicted PurR-regulated permease PerM